MFGNWLPVHFFNFALLVFVCLDVYFYLCLFPLFIECSRRGRTGAAVIVDPLIPTTATYISSVTATASPTARSWRMSDCKIFYDFSLAFLSVGEYQDTANR